MQNARIVPGLMLGHTSFFLQQSYTQRWPLLEQPPGCRETDDSSTDNQNVLLWHVVWGT